MSERVVPRTYLTTCTIASGASLSAEIDGKGMRLAKIFMPSGWTAASMTFAEAEASGGTFDPLYDGAWIEVTESVAASRTVAPLNTAALTSMCYFKVRSGTVASAVNQEAARTIGLLFVG